MIHISTIVHFRTRSMVRHQIAVHLSAMRHQNHQAVILRGKLRKQIQKIGKILRFRLPRCGDMLETVDRVEDEDAASPTQDKFTGFDKYPFRSGAAFEGDVTNVFGKKLFRTEQKLFRHAATVSKTVPSQLLDQFAEMVDDGIILRTEKRYLPLMAHTEAQHQFVQSFRFSGTQTVDQFVTQFESGRVGIYGYDDVFQIFEVRLHEAVEPRKVHVCSSRHGDHAFESDGKGGSGIQFAFVDSTTLKKSKKDENYHIFYYLCMWQKPTKKQRNKHERQ